VPLSIDSPLGVRPDLSRASDARAPRSPSSSEQAAFLEALARAQQSKPTLAARGGPTANEVPAQRTPLSGSDAASALGGAWQRTFGEAPSTETLSILVGQWAHETGRGSAMLNHNFGGIKGSGPDGTSAVYATTEGSGASATHGQARFRAYASAARGADDYVQLLSRRYPDAVSAAQRGDPSGFVHALAAKGYFTGDPGQYLKSVSSLAQQALRQGFDAVGAGAQGSSARGASGFGTVAHASVSDATAGLTPSTADALRAAGAVYGRHSFADEVGRAALLSSALRIGQAREREG
jgi:hypothetical protein